MVETLDRITCGENWQGWQDAVDCINRLEGMFSTQILLVSILSPHDVASRPDKKKSTLNILTDSANNGMDATDNQAGGA